MNLTRLSDCSLRMLIYLALHPERPVTIREIGGAYQVSPHVLVKAAERLISAGIVESVRGRKGGLRLAQAPSDVNIGRVVMLTEPSWNIVECFDADRNTCPIQSACGLKVTLRQAQQAFLDTLEQYTLADFLPRKPSLIRLLKRG